MKIKAQYIFSIDKYVYAFCIVTIRHFSLFSVFSNIILLKIKELMIHQILSRIFRSDKKKVKDILYDINLFYKFINQNGRILEDWYFQNVFTSKYWLHLSDYKWLTEDKLAYLHQGILNILLFRIHQHLEEGGTFTQIVFIDLQKALNSYTSQNETSVKLSNLVKDALELAKLKQQGKYDSNTNGKIYKSITWTLKHTILINTAIEIKSEKYKSKVGNLV